MSEFLTVRQVRAMFGVSAKSVRRWIKGGLVRAKKHRVTGTLFVERSEVQRLVEQLEDWKPGQRPVTFKEAPRPGASTEKEMDDMPKDDKKAAKAEQAQEQEQPGEKAQPKKAAPEREERATPKKRSGTIFDEEDEDAGEKDDDGW